MTERLVPSSAYCYAQTKIRKTGLTHNRKLKGNREMACWKINTREMGLNWVIQLLSCCCILTFCQSLTLSPCGEDSTLEVMEYKQDNRFTCDGLTSTDTAVWRLVRQGSDPTDLDIGYCPPPGYCTFDFEPTFTPSRPSASESMITVNAGDPNSFPYFQGRSLMCKTNNFRNDHETMCRLDLIAPPRDSSCETFYSSSPFSPWTITVSCNVTGVYSYLSRYTCQLVQSLPTYQTIGSRVSYTPTGTGKYKSGSCDVTIPFPTTLGTHRYHMTVEPGRVDVTSSLQGGQTSFQIRRPSSPPTHNCPDYVEEGQRLHCTCTATDAGQPDGIVRWRYSGSPQLWLSGPTRSQDGSVYVCEVMWNGQSVQTVSYTLHVVHYTARILQCPSGSVNVVEDRDDFSLTCDHYSGPVLWQFQPPLLDKMTVGTCDTSCLMSHSLTPGLFSLTKVSPTSSRLDFSSRATGGDVGVYTYYCDGVRCEVNIVGPHAQIQECPTGSVTIPANTSNFTLTCHRYLGPVTWYFQPPLLAKTTVGTCDSSCHLDSTMTSGLFSLTKLSSSSSQLELSSRATSSDVGTNTYFCEAESCVVHIAG